MNQHLLQNSYSHFGFLTRRLAKSNYATMVTAMKAFRTPHVVMFAVAIALSCRAIAATGDVDAGFNPNVGSTVTSTALQTDGKIVIGGSFTTVGGVMGALRGRHSEVVREFPAVGS